MNSLVRIVNVTFTKGVFIWSNGDRYEGAFKDNMRNGLGTYMYFLNSHNTLLTVCGVMHVETNTKENGSSMTDVVKPFMSITMVESSMEHSKMTKEREQVIHLSLKTSQISNSH